MGIRFKVNRRVFGGRLIQGATFLAIGYTIWGMFSLGYDVALVGLHAGLFILFTGAITTTALILWGSIVNDNLRRK